MSLKIHINPHFKKEKAYIISVLIGDFLGLNYELIDDENSSNYTISDGLKKIILDDDFFAHIQKENTYINAQFLPKHPLKIEYKNHQIISLYGKNKVSENNSEIVCEADIFASAFFMLSRWEECLESKKDAHKRFLHTESIAFKYGFLMRPIVNEYVEFLWEMLRSTGVEETLRKKRKFEWHLTHDVDHPLFFDSAWAHIKKPLYYLLKEKDVYSFSKFIFNRFTFARDPYNTFDYLMDKAEKSGIICQFNFMAALPSNNDEGYDLRNPFIQKLVKKIKERNHFIGFHPSYDTFNNPEKWRTEKERLEKALNTTVKSGRQHYLRFSNPETWEIWENQNMVADSTLGYPFHIGFRCGVCYPYHPFDVLKKQKMKLLEIPLLVMDGTLIDRMKLSTNEAVKQSIDILKTVKKYNGVYSLLWHNSSFFTSHYKHNKQIFESILNHE